MNALILVDLQNDFLTGGALAVPRGDEVIQLANRLQPFFPLIVATQDWHPPDHASFASQHPDHGIGDVIELGGAQQVLWPDHCVQGSAGGQLSAALNTTSISRIFPKGTDRQRDSYSGFFDNGGQHATGLGDYLRSRGATDVYILGLATDYCVRATAIDACKLGFQTWLIEDACRGVELNSGDCAAAVAQMQQAGVRCVSSKRWLAENRDSENFAARQELLKGRFISLVKSGRWEYARRNNASAVVVIPALTADDHWVFIEQYREPLGRRCIEWPAGLVGDAPGDEGEDLSEAVRRELIEETGFSADQVTELSEASMSAGLTDEVSSVYLAQGLRRIGDGGGVDGEQIQMHLVPRQEVAQWLAERQREGLDIAMSVYAGLWLAEQALSAP